MKKTMKYETPEIEITRFMPEGSMMNVVFPGGEETSQDGNVETFTGPGNESATDEGFTGEW